MENIELSYIIVLIFTVLGGVGLLTHGLHMISPALQLLGESFLKKCILWVGNSHAVNFFSGLVSNIFIQSNITSRNTALSFNSSGLFNYKQMCFFIFGSNVSVGIITFLFAYNWGWYELLMLGMGFWPAIFAKRKSLIAVGRVLLSLGLLMLGARLITMSLANFPELSIFISAVKFPSFVLVIFATFIGVLSRSFVVPVAVACILFNIDILSLNQSVYFCLGGLLSEFVYFIKDFKKFSSKAKKSLLLIATIEVIILFIFFIDIGSVLVLINKALYSFGVYPGQDILKVYKMETVSILILPSLVTFYFIICSLVSLVCFYPLDRVLSKIIQKPRGKEYQKLQLIGEAPQICALLAIEQSYSELKKMLAMVNSILILTKESVGTFSPNEIDSSKILKYEEVTDRLQSEMNEFLSSLMQLSLTQEQGHKVKSLMRLTSELESLADKCKAIFFLQKTLIDSNMSAASENIKKSKDVVEKILSLFELLVTDMTQDEESVFSTSELDQDFQSKIFVIRGEIQQLLTQVFKTEDDKLQLRVSSEMLYNYERIISHTKNIYESYRDFNKLYN